MYVLVLVLACMYQSFRCVFVLGPVCKCMSWFLFACVCIDSCTRIHGSVVVRLRLYWSLYAFVCFSACMQIHVLLLVRVYMYGCS